MHLWQRQSISGWQFYDYKRYIMTIKIYYQLAFIQSLRNVYFYSRRKLWYWCNAFFPTCWLVFLFSIFVWLSNDNLLKFSETQAELIVSSLIIFFHFHFSLLFTEIWFNYVHANFCGFSINCSENADIMKWIHNPKLLIFTFSYHLKRAKWVLILILEKWNLGRNK